MEKTKLGISVGLYAAITFLVSLFSGYLGLILLVGYALYAESDLWLKKTVVKAFLITVAFSVINYVIGFIPDILGFVESLVGLFSPYFRVPVVHSLLNALSTAIRILEKVVFLLAAIISLKKGKLSLGPVDKLIDKHFAAE